MDGWFHGEGIRTTFRGTQEIGYFKEGILEYGNVKYSNGDKYWGGLNSWGFHGSGKYIWANGDTFEGNFHQNYKHGYGTYTWVDGDKYYGEWKYDKLHGSGTLYKKDGSSQKMDYKDGVLVKPK